MATRARNLANLLGSTSRTESTIPISSIPEGVSGASPVANDAALPSSGNNYAGGCGGGGSGYVKSDPSITNSGMGTAPANNVDADLPGINEPEWGDRAGVGNYDHGSNGVDPFSGTNPETDISDWMRSSPGRFVITPL